MISELDKNINHRMAVIAALAKRLIYKSLNDEGLEITPDQWALLYYLWAEDGLTVGEIAGLSKKDFSNVTRIIDKLVRDGYVEKRNDIRDKRSFRVFLRPKANAIRERVEKVRNKTMSESISGISSEDQEFLLEILRVMEANISRQLYELDK